MTATVTSIAPCLWLDDQAEAAAAFYCEVFGSSRVTAVARYPLGVDNPSGRPPGSVVTVALELRGCPFVLLNGGPIFRPNPSISFFVYAADAAEVDQLHARLGDGGYELMPLGEYPWSPRYSWVQDRYGVSWQLIVGRGESVSAAIAPCLMFAGPQHGRASDAIEAYVRTFADSRVVSLERYECDEGPEGTVKHGRFVLAGQDFVAMDSHIDHGLTFSEGVSLLVSCAGQSELDRVWDALCDGGSPGPCGWLHDRFGVSWQVAPSAMAEWIGSPDSAASARVFAAMLTMGKLDVAALEQAFGG